MSTSTAWCLRELTFRVVAPSAWKERLQSASWKDVGKLPWVWINQFNSYNKLSSELFREKNIAPQKVFELDQESTTLALVKAGVGMSLMRDELAQEAIKSGEVIEWGDVRKTTPLNFIYPAECRDDPLVNAMLQVLHGMWPPATSASKTAQPIKNRCGRGHRIGEERLLFCRCNGRGGEPGKRTLI
jgi:DNA-binding transcriptional LysR family regulator